MTIQEIYDQIRVCVDIGSKQHYAVIGCRNGQLLAEFSFNHTAKGIASFFEKIKCHEREHRLPVLVAMEGYNGHARPIDRMVLEKGYRLFNVNNLKLARFKEIFAGPAKSDPIDAKKMLQLFDLNDTLPAAKNVLQEVLPISEEHEKLKRLTRRRRDLIHDKVRATNRLEADLQAVTPGLLEIAGRTDNLWFLRFLTARGDLAQLAGLQGKTIAKIPGVGKLYASKIMEWQKNPELAADSLWMGEMIVSDARKILGLLGEIASLDQAISNLVQESDMARLLLTIQGFGNTCAAEFAGEVGTLTRFKNERSLALYCGVAPLTNSSGKYNGARCARNVNYRVKSALAVVAFQQTQLDAEAKRYYEKKRKEGKTHKQAIRSYARHLIRVIWSMLRHRRVYEIRTPQCEQPTALSVQNSDSEARMLG